MATWQGWQNEFLKTVNPLPDATLVAFMNLWAAHADSPGCANNPIDLSHPEKGSSDCQALTGSRFSQRYADHATAVTAFNTEIHSGNFPALATLLEGGKIDLTTGNAAVESELNAWGSTNFSTFLGRNATAGGPPAPGIHKGWTELRKSVNKTLPGAFSESGKLSREALRSLSRAHKVKL